MSEKISIRGVHIDNVDMNEAVGIIDNFAKSKEFHCVFTPNAEIVELCIEDEEMRNIVNSADLVVPD